MTRPSGPAPATEATLLEAICVDLDGGYRTLVEAYGPVIYTVAARVCDQPADAEDLAAATFVRAYTALRGYPAQRIRQLRLRPWLVTITLNLWRNSIRDATRRPRLIASDLSSHTPADPAPSPEQQAIAADGHRELARLLASLPDPQRVAVTLRHVAGLPYDEIATALHCPVGTAKSHVSRGIAALRAQLTGTTGVIP